MRTWLNDSKAPTSIWHFLDQVDSILGQALPLATRLRKINSVLVRALDVDAIWFLVNKPIAPVACGLIQTPLRVAPGSTVSIMDTDPPIAAIWSDPDTLLGKSTSSKTPLFLKPNVTDGYQTGSDLGDILFSAFNIAPLAIIPLVADNSSLGVVVVGNRWHHLASALPEETQNLLIFLGKHLAQNLRNSYLAERANHHAEVLLTLNQLAQTITSSLDLDDVIQRTMTGINTILDVEAGSLLLLDEMTGELYFKITLRGENKQVTAYRLKMGEGIAGWIVANNKAVIVNNPMSDPRFLSKIDKAIGFNTTNVLGVPLVVKGKPIGALEVLNKRSGPFDEHDQQLLISMSAALGIALRNASLYQAAQERAHVNEVVNEISAAINLGHSLSETAKIIFKQFTRLFVFDHISISLLHSDKENVRQWTFGDFGSMERTTAKISLKGSRLAQTIKRGHGTIEDNLLHSEPPGKLYPDDKILQEDQITSVVSVPLIMQKTTYGSLILGSRQPDAYRAQDLKLLEQLTPQIAIAIDKALVIDTMEQRTSKLQMLNRFGEMLVSTTDINVLVDTVLAMLPRLLPGDVQGVVLASDEASYAAVAVPYGFNQVEETTRRIFETFLEMREGNILTELVSSKSIAGNMPVPPDWKPLTVLSLPILTGRGAQGIIYMASGKEEHIDDDLLRIFSLIVSQISAAVENAHLFQQVEQERARLAAILVSSTDAILVVDRNGRIVLDNPAAWDVVGSPETQSGRLLLESTASDTLINLFQEAMNGGTTTGEIPLDDGRTFFANLSPVSSGQAGAIGWVATMQDVSHFKEINELKNTFVNTVSHDLRSPLGGVMIAADLIAQTGSVNQTQQELLDLIENRARGMGQLIDNLLDVGKIEAGIDMDMKPYNIASMIAEIATDFMPQATEKNIELASSLVEDLPLVMANFTRLQQVIHNLVGNAIKYTPPHGQVNVKVFVQDDELRIQISDTGIGIPAADQPHIFDKFYRVHSQEISNITGTGLGLAIVKGIVEKHNGRIWLESVYGEGSTFSVALPLYEPTAPNYSFSASPA